MKKNLIAYIHVEMFRDKDGDVHINNKGYGDMQDVVTLLAYLAKDKPNEYHLALDNNIQSIISSEDEFMKKQLN